MIRSACLGSEDEVCDPGQLNRMVKILREPELKGDASADRHRLRPGFRKAIRLATERSGPNGHVSEIVVNQLVRENADGSTSASLRPECQDARHALNLSEPTAPTVELSEPTGWPVGWTWQ